MLLARRIVSEDAETETAEEHPRNQGVNLLLRDESELQRLLEVLEARPAFDGETVPSRQRHGFRRCLHDLVAPPDVADGPAVADDVSVEAPFAAQDVLQEQRARAGALAVDAVVRAHHGLDAPLAHARLEGGQIGLAQVLLRRADVKGVPFALGTGMDGVVLRAGRRLQVDGIVPLDAADERDAHPSGEVRIFAPRLDAASPAGIAEDVHVRTPEVEPRVHLPPASGGDGRKILDAPLVRNRRGDLAHELRIETRRHADRLGEHGRASVAPDAVQRLAPVIVGGDAEPGNRRSLVPELRALLVDRHLRDQRRRLRLQLLHRRRGSSRRERRHSNRQSNSHQPFTPSTLKP